MSERVELEVVGGVTVGGFDEVTKHSYGLYVGAKRYKHKIKSKIGEISSKIDLAATLVKEAQESARQYAIKKGIDYVPGYAGVALKYIRYKVNGMKTAAEKLKEMIDVEWREYLDEAYEKLGTKYKSIKDVS